MARLHAGEAPLVARRFAGGPAADRSAPWCRAGCSRLPGAADVSGTLLAHPSSRIAVPVVLGVGQRADSGFDVVPATLVVERSPNRRRDERAALTPTNPAVESMHEFVVETYVQTHGHKLAHTVIRLTIYSWRGRCRDPGRGRVRRGVRRVGRGQVLGSRRLR